MGEINLRLDKNIRTPLVEQLYSFIKQEIISGHFAKNEKLPSKRGLAANLQCSRNTVQAAYNQLVDEGYLISRAKSGYYVAELDGILNLGSPPPAAGKDAGRPEEYLYDLSPRGVDFECFPFSLWRKITREVISDYDKDFLKECEPQGYYGLRAGIARYLHHSRNVDCTPEQIIISSGAEMLVQLLVQLFDGSCVYAIENPGYEKLNMIFKCNRVQYRPVPLDKHGMRPDALLKSMADVAYIAPSHQFPTGCIMPASRRIRLLNWAYEKQGRYIIEDDYDSEFRYSGKPIPSMQGLDRQKKVIYIGAFSKSLTPALRISYMVLPENLLKIYNEKLSFYICPVPIMEQKTLQRFIDEGHFERHLNRMRSIYRQKREIMVGAIKDMLPGAEVSGASAGLNFTLRVNNGMCERELVEKAGERKVKVYGMSRYYSGPPEKRDETLLMGFATLEKNNIPDAVSLLAEAWM